METATQPQPKRVRFDSSALSPDDAIATPMAAARSSLQTHCASLQPEIANFLLTLGKEHLLLMQKTLHDYSSQEANRRQRSHSSLSKNQV
jgi:hypothetical protein